MLKLKDSSLGFLIFVFMLKLIDSYLHFMNGRGRINHFFFKHSQLIVVTKKNVDKEKLINLYS